VVLLAARQRREKYELAKMVRLELMSDEIIDIADASIASERTEGDVEAKDADLLTVNELPCSGCPRRAAAQSA